MACGLGEEWQRLKLIADEEQIVVVEDDEDNAKDKQIALCLFGCLHTQSSFNARAMKSMLQNLWKPAKGLVFWVKVYDVPGKKQTTSFTHLLALNIGEVVSCEEATLFGVEKALCFRVDIDINKPLRRGIHVQVTGKLLWICFKYVKLSDFCYGCGQPRHVLGGCDVVEAGEDNPCLQYGPWLSASPLKSRRRNAKSEFLEEKKLFLALQNKRAQPMARTKLMFDNPTFIDTAANGNSSGKIDNPIMCIDQTTPIVLGNEAFKRKLAPNLVFLSETKRSIFETSAILHDLGNYVGVFVDARGRAGGLALLWDKTTNVQFLFNSLHRIYVTVQWDGDGNAWRFSGIYGWPESQQK
ncbi:hypothetical protein Cgig2_000184 [Carnegiea gigantea]|uniref:Zinc knuckle CX2CX4HX4C domain-containing protein n=1 Tax=Carnegiea gigantea TaxID=171969 RepID=A0A9Q1QKQ3_9CARY|nr:hypothetical protein Cgig2_000184 [Carnegiea gigantea]